MKDNPSVNADKKNYVARDVQPTVLRLHPETRATLVRLAAIHGRSLSKEIALRLEQSLEAESAPPPSQSVKKDKGPVDPLSEIDRAMLAVFRQMPVEKQLALLSLLN